MNTDLFFYIKYQICKSGNEKAIRLEKVIWKKYPIRNKSYFSKIITWRLSKENITISQRKKKLKTSILKINFDFFRLVWINKICMFTCIKLIYWRIKLNIIAWAIKLYIIILTNYLRKQIERIIEELYFYSSEYICLPRKFVCFFIYDIAILSPSIKIMLIKKKRKIIWKSLILRLLKAFVTLLLSTWVTANFFCLSPPNHFSFNTNLIFKINKFEMFFSILIKRRNIEINFIFGLCLIPSEIILSFEFLKQKVNDPIFPNFPLFKIINWDFRKGFVLVISKWVAKYQADANLQTYTLYLYEWH